jgi:hypothetical protein
MVELDHVYVVVPRGAANEIALLRANGFHVDSTVARHTGDGTASVTVFFENAYFELLWLDPDVEAAPEQEGRVQMLRRATEWRTSGVSPFGIGLRRVAGFTAPLPVPSHRDSAAFMEPGTAYEVLNSLADSMAADLFVVPPGRALTSWVARGKIRFPALFKHPGGARELSAIRLSGSAAQQPIALRVLHARGIEMRESSSPLLELELDRGRRGERLDLRPLLPVLILR